MEILIYSKDDCKFCEESKKFLDHKELPYTEYKIGEHLTREEFMDKFPGVRSVPCIVIDGEYIGGFNQLKEKL